MRAAAALPLLLAAAPCASAFSAALPSRPGDIALPRAAAQRPLRGVGFGRWRRGAVPAARPSRPLRAEGKEDVVEASGEKSLEADFGKAAFGTGVLTVAEVLFAFRSWGSPTAGLTLGVVPVFLSALVALRVLQSAASRGRLSGGTFRMMSLATLAAFATMFAVAGFDVMKVALVVLTGNGSWPTFVGLVLGIVAINTAVPAIGASYGTLVAEGLPKFKTAIRAEKGRKGLLTLLAVGYVVTTMHQLIWGSAMLLYSNFKVIGALRCFVMAACAHVCQTAAVAGPKRLSSETYRKLNLVLMLDSAVCFATVAFIGAAIRNGTAAVATVGALPFIGLLAAGGGWAVGTFYRPE